MRTPLILRESEGLLLPYKLAGGLVSPSAADICLKVPLRSAVVAEQPIIGLEFCHCYDRVPALECYSPPGAQGCSSSLVGWSLPDCEQTPVLIAQMGS